MKTFKGLALDTDIAFYQIAVMIEAGLIAQSIDNKDGTDVSDILLYQAHLYAKAAHDYAKDNNK